MNQGFPKQPRRMRADELRQFTPAHIITAFIGASRKRYADVVAMMQNIERSIRDLDLETNQFSAMMQTRNAQGDIAIDQGMHYLSIWVSGTKQYLALAYAHLNEQLEAEKFVQGEMHRWLRGQLPTSIITVEEAQKRAAQANAGAPNGVPLDQMLAAGGTAPAAQLPPGVVQGNAPGIAQQGQPMQAQPMQVPMQQPMMPQAPMQQPMQQQPMQPPPGMMPQMPQAPMQAQPMMQQPMMQPQQGVVYPPQVPVMAQGGVAMQQPQGVPMYGYPGMTMQFQPPPMPAPATHLPTHQVPYDPNAPMGQPMMPPPIPAQQFATPQQAQQAALPDAPPAPVVQPPAVQYATPEAAHVAVEGAHASNHAVNGSNKPSSAS